jgi:hypothetical protein
MARDYILRLIDHVALMLAEIVAKRKIGSPAESRTEIENQALQHTGLPLSLIRSAAPAMVADLLRNGGELRFIRGVLLAELMLQDAEICEETGDKPGALTGYLHAWCLLHDAAISFNPEERRHFGAKQDHARTRLSSLAGELGVDLAGLVPEAFFSKDPG